MVRSASNSEVDGAKFRVWAVFIFVEGWGELRRVRRSTSSGNKYYLSSTILRIGLRAIDFVI